MLKFFIKALVLISFCTACTQSATPIQYQPGSTATASIVLTTSPRATRTSIPIDNPQSGTPPANQAGLAVITGNNVTQLERLVTLTGHTDRISDLAFSPDGAYLASTGYEQKIRLWDVNTWQEVYTLPNAEADLNTLAFSPDGHLLATGLAIWNVSTRETVFPLEERLVEPGHVTFSPDGSKVVVVSSGKIRVWDVASGAEVLAFQQPSDSLYLFSISYSPDGKWLAASSGGNGKVYFWSAETGELAFSLEQGNEHDVHDLAFTPDGQLLATGGSDHYARIWNVADREVLQKMPIIGMYSLAISPDGALLATAGPDRAVKLWDVASGKMLNSLPHADELMAVAFSADGRLIAAGGYDDTLVVWGIGQ